MTDDQNIWQHFAQEHSLSEHQLTQFQTYFELLGHWNEKINLTRIVTLPDVVAYHFSDSLQIDRFVDFKNVRGIADVGTGAGFPGLALKIKHPHLACILIEVNNKKIQFLKTVIEKLGLENVEIYPYDWRMFLRTVQDDVDVFVARASLSIDELLRVFKPASPYKDARLIYWHVWIPLVKYYPILIFL